MSSVSSLRNSLPRKSKHWSYSVLECAIQRGPTGNFNLHIVGGAENGEFICVGDVKQERLMYRRGKIYPGDVVLEINGTPVAGYTQFDVLPLIKSSKDAVNLRIIKPGEQINRDLQKYLSTRFDKNSVDSSLQQTIRENLYNRTIPCTTRKPRNGEIPGEDYNFLSYEEFRKLEESGALLECGIFEGNHYGTPKPPREPLPSDNLIFVPAKKGNLHQNEREDDRYDQPRSEDNNLGPLPPNWEIAYTENNIKYFVNHSTGSTQWVDPRLAQVKKASADDCDDDELPYGWERVEDPKYGTYYIDHMNRKTQFENPVQALRRHNHTNSMSSFSSGPPPHEGPPSFQSAAALAKAQEAEAHSRWPDVEFSQSLPPAYTVNGSNHEPRSYPYSIDGQQLQGQVIRTELLKGYRGFGFTIVGGDQVGELLQVKSIVPDGAAAKDGKLQTGDALMRVNGASVMSLSHQDVVSMFQAMPMGDSVELEVIRGYPLPFDPDDPNVETIGSYTVVQRRQSVGSESPVPRSSEENSPTYPSFPPPPPAQQAQGMMNKWGPTQDAADSSFAPASYDTGTFPRSSTMNTLSRSSPEVLTIPVVKGPMGFGFTIADSPYGQKVKQILDAPRCQGLLEGDILMEINGRMIRSCTHNEAVNILKECPKGREAFFVIQRGGLPTPLRNSPLFGKKDLEPVAPRAARPKSTPSISSNHIGHSQFEHGSTGNLATAGESTRNQETGYGSRRSSQPPLPLDKKSEALFNSYPSLKKAIAKAARRSVENLASPEIPPPPASPDAKNFTVHLKRGEMGFGFRIIGGQEENTQVSIGTIVRGGPADLSGQVQRGDEIHQVDGINVIGSTHRRVISLMGNAALSGEVTLGIHRDPAKTGRMTPTMRRSFSASSDLGPEANLGSTRAKESSKSLGNLEHYGRKPSLPGQEESSSVRSFHSTPGEALNSVARSHSQRNRRVSEGDVDGVDEETQGPTSYRDITLERQENESFGFVIFSSLQKSGSTIGRIIQGSPADRCRQLHVGDRLVAVNGASIIGVHHSDIVDTIKQSGRSVTLTIAQQRPLDNFETKRLSRMSAPDISRAGNDSFPRRESEQRTWENSYNEQSAPDISRAGNDSFPRRETEQRTWKNSYNEQSAPDISRAGNDSFPRRETEQRTWKNSYNEQSAPDISRAGNDSFPRRESEQRTWKNSYNEQSAPDISRAGNDSFPRRESEQRTWENSYNEQSAPDISRAGNDSFPRRESEQRTWENSYNEQAPREEPRFVQTLPRNAHLSSSPKLLPKVPPRVAPKPTREKVLMAKQEKIRQESSMPRNDMRRRSNPEIPARPPLPSQEYSRGVADDRGFVNKTMEVELTRDRESGYGFSIRGGRELDLPIFVLRMADGGSAQRDGRLKVGDEILEINGRSTEDIPHADAIALIKSRGNRVHLLIHRHNKPAYLDGIPNGGQTIPKGGSLPRQSWKNPSYHGMYQS
ncbi:membrane-associated guanylate kinase, WW and PDZ domain-containing protein 3-like isoform X1 [Montipora capricornis]|uniref:membrane-associated guanylate kinase, WW and PDZ domain-containing protein 3-like isoform X1 n=1 Tax=Montipora capricornis TaxID=246305 RepID=UPI0035F1DCAB